MQWKKLKQTTVKICNSEFEGSMKEIIKATESSNSTESKSTEDKQLEMLLLVSKWIERYLKSHPDDDEIVSGFILSRSFTL